MQREIKFRGLRDNGEWAYGYLFIRRKHGADHYYIGRGIQNGSCYGFEVDKNTIGQFINQCDLSGKEVYEGDILESYPTRDIRFVISYGKSGDYGTYGWTLESHKKKPIKVYSMDDSPSRMNIVGNIHQNPKLASRKPKK